MTTRQNPLEARALRVASLVILIVTVLTAPVAAKTTGSPLAARLDALLTKIYPAQDPGAAVIVVRDGKPILRKGYGMADIELGSPIEPNTVFRIGSMTKQFTAVATLMLIQDGKLALDDPITKFFPDYPTHGKTITVENLLTHTSGIRDYTEMPDFVTNTRKDYTVKEMIDHFSAEPLDFDPGTKWRYDNSGYFLLGAIIEKVSGMPWGMFLQKRIFDPVGMTETYVGSNERIIPHRASGYTRGSDGGFENAPFLSMTQPYAAGVLFSTVDDLAKWDAVLYTDTLVRRELLEKAWTPYHLKDGSSTHYGYGWQVGSWDGHRVIQHDGGINGFITDGIRLPDDHVYIAVLTNDERHRPNAELVAQRVATWVLGKPVEAPPRITVPEEKLREYVGVYRIDANTTRTVTVENGKLYTQRSGGGKVEAIPTRPDEFHYDEVPTRLRFDRDATGKVVGMTMLPFGSDPEKAVLTNEKPAEHTAVALDPSKLDHYLGRYELAPGFVLAITREGDQLWAQATGQPKFEIFPESETVFFLEVVDAQIEFTLDPSGVATGLTLHQAGQNIPGKKLE